MITKTVTSGQRSAAATISEETKFVFSDKWNFFHVQNLGTGTVYIGMSAGVTAGNDGVIAIPSGGSACTMHNFPADSVYITAVNATDTVQIIGSNSAFSPFKSGKKGGGTNTSDATATAADIIAGKTAYIADGTKATGTAVQGIYPIGTDGRPTGNVTVPSGVTSLYQYIFYINSNVTSVNLPNTLTSLGNNCFQSCTSLTSIIIPTSVTSLGDNCFNNCTSLSSITIPTSVTSLGINCFQNCTLLSSITIPSGVTTIRNGTFYNCTSLSSITIPSGVTSIGAAVFNNCTFTTMNCNVLVCSFSTSFSSLTTLTTFNTVSGFNPTGLNLSYSTALSVTSMVSMFNNLATIGTTKTITLGATNLAKLTTEQKAIATGKGWTLA